MNYAHHTHKSRASRRVLNQVEKNEALTKLRHRRRDYAMTPRSEGISEVFVAKVNAIRTLPEVFQPRELSLSHVDTLTETLSSSFDLDPIIVLREKKYWLVIDGHHRLAAYRRANRKEVPCREFLGNIAAALLATTRDNAKDTLNMTKREKCERAWTLLIEQGNGMDHWQIAKATGVSKRTVDTMMATLKADRYASQKHWQEVLRDARSTRKGGDPIKVGGDDALAEDHMAEREALALSDLKARLAKQLGPTARSHPDRLRQALLAILPPEVIR